MFKSTLISLGFITGVVVSMSGCSGDDDDNDNGGASSSQVDTGLPEDKPLSEITAEEALTACEKMAPQFEALVTSSDFTRVICTSSFALFGPLTGQDVTVANCNTFVKDCVENPPEDDPEDAPEEQCTADSAPDFSSCSATVGEYEACISGYIAAAKTQLAEVTCESVVMAIDSEEPPQQEVTLPEACEGIQTSCPEALPTL